MEKSQNADIEKLEAAYQQIENAIYDRRLVEHCSIDQDGKAVGWAKWMGSDFRAFHPSRYRIDGKDVWPNLSEPTIEQIRGSKILGPILDWTENNEPKKAEAVLKILNALWWLDVR